MGFCRRNRTFLLLPVVRLVLSYFPSPSADYGFFFIFLCLLCEHANLNLISPVEVFGTFWCLAVILSYFCCLLMGIVCVFCRTGTLDWMVVMAVHSWWLGSVILSCTVVCHYLLTVISNLWNIISGFLVVISNVTDIYSVCPCLCLCLGGSHVCAALRRRRSRRSWRRGKLCITPGLNPLGPESFAGSVVLTVGS